MSSPAPAHRLDWIDALRGFAALWVFLYHIWNAIFPWNTSQIAPLAWDSTQPWYYYPSFFLFQYGYFGVTIFFVVSGFCIHLPQARRYAATGKDGLKLESFFQRRFWRLYPAYFGSLFVASLSLAVMRFMEYRAKGWPLPLPDHFYEQAFGVNEIGYNALFLLPFFESAKDLNSVLWTLVFEVQFYVMYPLLLWLMRRAGLVPVGVVLLVFECWLMPSAKTQQSFQNHNPWDYFFLGKYFEWYLGVVAAELIVRRQVTVSRSRMWWLVAVGVVYSCGCIFFEALWPTRDIAVALTTFFALLGLVSTHPTTATPSNVLFRFFVWVGLFSYSLYLLHIPLLRMVNAGNALFCEWIGHPEWTPWLLVDSIPVVLAVSWGFFWILERPFLHPIRKNPVGHNSIS